MGVSMFVMQKMTPTAMDPAQQRIMMLMPLVLGGHVLRGPRRAQPVLAGLATCVRSSSRRSPCGCCGRERAAAAKQETRDEGPRSSAGVDVADGGGGGRRALGLPTAALRYVVLGGGPARAAWACRPTPARIAVLLEDAPGGPGRRAAAGRARPRAAQRRARRPRGADPRRVLEPRLRALAEAASVDLAAEVEESEGRPGASGWRARPRVLPRGRTARSCRPRAPPAAASAPSAGRAGSLVECEGYRERRDEAAAAEALRAGRGGAGDGQPRRDGPLNAYERRIVHMALPASPGIRTFSVGEGADRRVTIAPAEDATAPARLSPPAGLTEHRGRLLAALGLPAAGRASRLAAYLDLLAAWSPRVNLTGARTPAERVRLLVAPVLPRRGRCLAPGRLIDVGSGQRLAGPGAGPAAPRLAVDAARAPRSGAGPSCARRRGRRAAPTCDVLRRRHDGYRGPARRRPSRARAGAAPRGAGPARRRRGAAARLGAGPPASAAARGSSPGPRRRRRRRPAARDMPRAAPARLRTAGRST